MKKMKNKLLFVLAFVFLAFTVMTVFATNFASAIGNVDIKEMKVYVKGELVWMGQCSWNGTSDPEFWTCNTPWTGYMPSLEAGETIDVKVAITGGDQSQPIQHVIMRSWFRVAGSTIEDETADFDLYAKNQYIRTMYLKVPTNLKIEEKTEPKVFTLHVEIEADETLEGINEAEILMDGQRLSEDLSIKSISVSGACVEACEMIYADVVVKNTGSHDVDDIYVRASIKELPGVTATAYIDRLVAFKEEDEDISRQVRLGLQLPSNVQSGTYTLEIKVSGEDVDDVVQTQQFTISGNKAEPKTVEIIPQMEQLDISAGQSATYTMIVTNQGTSTQTFTVETTGLESWSTVQLNPATFSLAAGESKLVSIYVTAKDDVVSGPHLFSAKVRYGQESKTLNFTANVAEKKTALDLKSTLMIVGIVLAVAIIILLIVLLAQKTKTEEKTEESYY